MHYKKIEKILKIIFYRPEKRLFIIVNDILAALTMLSVFSLILETVPNLHKYNNIFHSIELISVAIFSLEYIARIIASDNKLKYIFSFFGIIDLLAVLPTYLSFGNFVFLKSVRVLRILRFLRMMRLTKIIRLKKEKNNKDVEDYHSLYYINLQIYFFILFSAIIFFGSLIFVIEDDYNYFSSIPHGMLWATKVILGGIPSFSPSTVWGEIVSVMARFMGLILFGLMINVTRISLKRLFLGKIDKEIQREMNNSL